VEHTTLRLADYRRFLADHADSIEAFRHCQREAFAGERQRWREAGLSEAPAQESAPVGAAVELPPGSDPVYCPSCPTPAACMAANGCR
jgi:urea carboxylase